MKKILFTITFVLLSLGLCAQEQGTSAYQEGDAASPRKEQKKKSSGVITGLSGGMMIHGGYLFTDDPRKVFSSTGLGSDEYMKSLPKSGFTMGIGGALRLHLINHIHVGAEGFVSTMPLMGSGSNVRSGWGGAFCDAYTEWGKVRPMIGLTIGGGSMSRLFVPDEAQVVSNPSDSISYNASYTKTPFFLLDPYIGLEIALQSHVALLIRVDYMLPFGKSGSSLTENVNWSNFMSPNGPRLYVGFMFGKLKKR